MQIAEQQNVSEWIAAQPLNGAVVPNEAGKTAAQFRHEAMLQENEKCCFATQLSDNVATQSVVDAASNAASNEGTKFHPDRLAKAMLERAIGMTAARGEAGGTTKGNLPFSTHTTPGGELDQMLKACDKRSGMLTSGGEALLY